ncbi:hypothetical protein CCO03_08675 [Comamonas serinivorans]|uniref:Uncharacterized protein n=1 Tax=Comamonas serinivorans TaxID=1082851 RepID=A0A1Y0EMQ8_9BURK|nr:hypothetical protein [Comamonas serinivorans]ARU04741.1 hypothetical protein CCO03_08675 [Comamonas serinivorans]
MASKQDGKILFDGEPASEKLAMSIRKKLALWLCPELGEQLNTCRTAWAKHYLDVSDFLDLGVMTDQEWAEVREMTVIADRIYFARDEA